MSKPAMEDVFVLSGRRNRKSFAVFNLIVFGLSVAYTFVVLVFMSILGIGMSGSPTPDPFFLFLVAPMVLAVYMSTLCVGAQRCRDFGWSGWTVLVSLVPYVGFAFYIVLFANPGTVGENRYGPDPLL